VGGAADYEAALDGLMRQVGALGVGLGYWAGRLNLAPWVAGLLLSGAALELLRRRRRARAKAADDRLGT